MTQRATNTHQLRSVTSAALPQRFKAYCGNRSRNKRWKAPDVILRKIARPLLASAFIASGAELLRAKPQVAETVQPMVDTGRDALPAPVANKLPANAATAMRIAGAVQVGGGVLLATGKMPRVASGALAVSLLPVTAYDAAFFTETDPVRREARKVGLIKNAGLLGGVLIASADTAGEPSVAWRTRHAVAEAKVAGQIAAKEATLTGQAGKRAAKKAAKRAAKQTLRAHGHPVAALAVPIAVKAGSSAVAHAREDGHDDLHDLGERAAVLADKARGKAEVAAVKAKANAPIVAEKARNRAEEAALKLADRAPVVADEAKQRAEDLAGKVAERAPVVAEKARTGAEQAKEKAADFASTVADRAPEVAEEAGQKVADAGHKVARRVRKAQEKAAAKAKKAAAKAS